MATVAALAPVVAGVLGLAGSVYMWWSNRKAAANTPVMRENAISARDQATLQQGDAALQAPDDKSFEEGISR